jgi:hypothetical protein
VDEPADDLSRQGVTLGVPGQIVPLKPGVFKQGLSLPLLEPGQAPTPTTTWTLTPAGGATKFSTRNLRTIVLVVTYASKPSF